MKTRALLAASIVTVGTASAAFAQAPGSYYAQPPSETTPQPPEIVVVPTHEVEPMADRFAVNVGVGGMGVTAKDAPDGTEPTNFNVAELQLRFRATRRLELLLAFTGGREQLENDQQGDLAMDQVTLGLRFNFRPEHHWNWYLMAGFGSTLIAPHDTPEEARDDLRRAHGMFGIGIEHRWQHFALQAEMRGVSVEKRDDMDVIVNDVGRSTDLMGGQELGGGQFTLAGSYYF